MKRSPAPRSIHDDAHLRLPDGERGLCIRIEAGCGRRKGFGRQNALPLAVCHRFVVKMQQLALAAHQKAGKARIFIGTLHLALTVTEPAAVGIVKGGVDEIRCRNLHAEKFEEGVAFGFGKRIVDAADAEIQLLEAVDPAPRFIAVSGLRKDVAGKVLHFADIGDLRIAFIDVRAFFAELARELFVEPCGEIVVHAMNGGFGAGGIPPESEEIFHVLFERLQRADIIHPDLADAVFIGFAKFRSRLRERDAVDEEIAQRRGRFSAME